MHTQAYRWIVLTVYLLVAGISQLLWLNFAPLISFIEKQYQFSESTASILLLVFPLIYVLLSIPAGILTDKKGYKFSVGLGAILMAVFSCLRIYTGSFTLLLIAQVGIAIGQPFAINGISKLVMDWFSKEQAILATGLGTMGMFIGMAIGMAATPPMVESMGFQNTMIAFAAITISIALLFLIFAKSNSLSQPENLVEVGMMEGFKPLIKNGDLLKVFLIAFMGLGFFNGLTTWLELILAPNGINSVQAGTAGGVLILGGIFGAVIIPALSDHFKKRKPFLVGSSVIALLTLYPLCTSQNYGLVLILSAIQGFFFLPAFALLLDIGSDLAGKSLAGSATGILMLAGNAGGVLVIIAMEWVKGDSLTFLPGVILMMIALAIAIVTSLLLPKS
jgi:cyanate permease